MESGTRGHVPCSVQSGPLVISLVSHAGGAILPPHRHDEATVTVALGGEYQESLGGGLELLSPMSMAAKPPGTVHANHVGPSGARSLLVAVDASRMNEVDGAPSLFSTPRVVPVGPAAAVALRLVGELQRRDEWTALSVEALTAELFTGLARERRHDAEIDAPAWLDRVREKIHETPVANLRLADLSREAGRHGSLVARTFRRRYGTSVGEYARRLRVARVARDLTLRPQLSLSRIALDAGYCEHSHMTHDFRSRTGIAPTTWRELSACRDAG
jgi:AraC family transcriptional regulator